MMSIEGSRHPAFGHALFARRGTPEHSTLLAAFPTTAGLLSDDVRKVREAPESNPWLNAHFKILRSELDLIQHELLIAEALAGHVVVRLKGGDPYVFGRGWEEGAACAEAGVPWQVVPGVSSALAAPAAAGIPITLRGVARSFAVVTARSGEEFAASDGPDYHSLAGIDTVVFLMARERLAEVAASLVLAGRDAATPAAVVERGTQPGQRVVVGTLRTIARDADSAGIEAPAVLVVGPTAALASPSAAHVSELAGMRILVTRPPYAAAPLAAEIRSRGGEAIEAPLIRIEYADVDLGSLRSHSWQWIVFTSLHGVRGFWRAVDRHGWDARALAGMRIAAIGPKTAGTLRSLGLKADLIAPEHRATSLIKVLASEISPGERVLFPCGTLAREETALGLRRAGAVVEELVVYRTSPVAPSGAALRRIARGIDAVLLHSPSAVRSLIENDVPIGDAVIACIGPTTADEATRLGLRPTVVPTVYSDAGLLDALESHLQSTHGAMA